MTVVSIIVAVVAAVLVLTSKRVRPYLPRFAGCAVGGLLVAGALTWFEDTKRHAALVAAAARSGRTGQHLSVHAILGYGFAGTAVIVTAVLLLVVAAARRRRPAQRRTAARPGDQPFWQ